MKDALTKSPKTTAGGVLLVLSVLFACLYAQFDGDPATVPSWAELVPAVLAAFALFQARDHGVTSEKAGAK